MFVEVLPGAAPVLAAGRGAGERSCSCMGILVPCQIACRLEQAGAVRVRACEGPVVGMCPAVGCKAALLVKSA